MPTFGVVIVIAAWIVVFLAVGAKAHRPARRLSVTPEAVRSSLAS